MLDLNAHPANVDALSPKRQLNLRYKRKKMRFPREGNRRRRDEKREERREVCFALGNISVISCSISFTNQV